MESLSWVTIHIRNQIKLNCCTSHLRKHVSFEYIHEKDDFITSKNASKCENQLKLVIYVEDYGFHVSVSLLIKFHDS